MVAPFHTTNFSVISVGSSAPYDLHVAGSYNVTDVVVGNCGSATEQAFFTISQNGSKLTIKETVQGQHASFTATLNQDTATWNVTASGVVSTGSITFDSNGNFFGTATSQATIYGQSCTSNQTLTGINTIPINNNTTTTKNCPIGAKGPAGGIMFYFTDANCAHGLEAAPVDQSSGVWGCVNEHTGYYAYITVGTTGSAIGTGAANTAAIIASCPEASAAATAAAYTLNGYAGWYLPSKDKLTLLYHNRGDVGGFANIESEVDKATSKSCSLWDMAVGGDLMSLYFLRSL